MKIQIGVILAVNTYEPPELVETNPDIVYELEDDSAVKKAIEKEIKIALEAVKILHDDLNKTE